MERYFAPGKAALLSVGEKIDTRSAAGRLVLNVLASVTQWDREAIGERTAMAMQHQTPGQEGGAGDGGSARFPNGSVIYLVGADQRGRAPEAARAEVRAGSDRRGPGLRHRPAAARVRGPEAAVADYRGTIVLTGTPGNLIKGLFFDVTNGREPEQSLPRAAVMSKAQYLCTRRTCCPAVGRAGLTLPGSLLPSGVGHVLFRRRTAPNHPKVRPPLAEGGSGFAFSARRRHSDGDQ